MNEPTNVTQLPIHVARSIRRYAPRLQKAIVDAVRDRMAAKGGAISPEEIGQCASAVIFGDGTEYDRRMEAICLKAFDAGSYTPLDEVINELRTTVAATRSS